MAFVSIDGVEYPLVESLYAREFLQVVRQQADNGQEPSEFSLNPQDLWRRSQDDWNLGPGQTVLDETTSVRARVRTSEGLNHFGERRQIGLAYDSDVVTSVASDSDIFLLADNKVWYRTGTNQLGFSEWNGSSWTHTTTTALSHAIVDAATDGTNVYVAMSDGASNFGIYRFVKGSTTATLMTNLDGEAIYYVSGRLLVTKGTDIWNILDISTTTAPGPITADAVSIDFTWTTFGQGRGFIFACGNAGDYSMIYRLTVRQDGTRLTSPVAAARMPDGEFVKTITTYLGVVVIGTNKGIRIGIENAGSISYGPIIDEVTGGVSSLEPQAEYVYYTANGSVARLNLTEFVENLDLVPTRSDYAKSVSSTDVKGIVTYEDKTVFIQNGTIYEVDKTSYTSTGTFNTGKITYRMADPKYLVFLDIQSEVVGNDSIEYSVTDETGRVMASGVIDTNNTSQSISVNEKFEWCSIDFTFNSDDGTTSPSLIRWTTRSHPSPKRTEQIRLGLQLNQQAAEPGGHVNFINTVHAYQSLASLVKSGEIVEYEEFGECYDVTLENIQYGGELRLSSDYGQLEGIAVVTMRIYSS